MNAKVDPRIVESAADLAVRYGVHAIPIARALAASGRDQEISAFWRRVLGVLMEDERNPAAAGLP